MFFLKACPKCHGDLVIEASVALQWGEAPDVTCIQCGYAARAHERDALLHKMNQALRRRATPRPSAVPVARAG